VKIAIIGSGIAGLTSAYLLSRRHATSPCSKRATASAGTLTR